MFCPISRQKQVGALAQQVVATERYGRECGNERELVWACMKGISEEEMTKSLWSSLSTLATMVHYTWCSEQEQASSSPLDETWTQSGGFVLHWMPWIADPAMCQDNNCSSYNSYRCFCLFQLHEKWLQVKQRALPWLKAKFFLEIYIHANETPDGHVHKVLPT